MNILKNRTVLGTICICIALVICFIIAPMFNAAASATVDVVRVKHNIKIGQQITANDIEVVQAGYHNFKNTAQSVSEVVGRYAAFKLFEGEFLMLSKTAENPANENIYLYELTGEKQVISVTISSFANGLSGKLMSGDIVSIIAPDFMGTGETVVPDELQYVEVIAVTHNSGSDINENGFSETSTKPEPDGSEERKLPSTVTVLVRPEQAKLLAQLENKGDIHVALVYRGNADKAQEFISIQDEILNKKYTVEEIAEPIETIKSAEKTQMNTED